MANRTKYKLLSTLSDVVVYQGSFIPSTGSAEARGLSGALDYSGSWGVKPARQDGGNSAARKQGAWQLEFSEPHGGLLDWDVSFSPSGTLEGSGSDGRMLGAQNHISAKKVFTKNNGQTLYFHVIQTSGSVTDNGTVSRFPDAKDEGPVNRPVDVSGSVNGGRVHFYAAFMNLKNK